MTVFLYHGEDQVASRNLLYASKRQYSTLRELNGEKITPLELKAALGNATLFGEETLVIENLFTRPRSKLKDECLALLTDPLLTRPILCWEKKALTKAVTAKLPKHWKIIESKSPAVLFTFLDAIIPGNHARAHALLTDLRRSSEDGFIFIMLSRHLQNLILAQSATNPKLPPWQLGKLKSQASSWSESALLKFYDELFRLDLQLKTGNTKLDLRSQLDILLLTVLG